MTTPPRAEQEPPLPDRRRFLAAFSALGIGSGLGLGSTLLPGVLWAKLQESDKRRIDKSMFEAAERIAGLEFTDEERGRIVAGVNEHLESYRKLRAIPLDNSVPPALQFSPVLPGMELPAERGASRYTEVDASAVPADDGDLAFAPLTRLAALVKARKVSATELAKLYLQRLRRYDPVLRCVVTLTEELALAQARRADEEIAAGRYRGPLHGIPWGAKDLLSVKGYRTTWGAEAFKDQVIDEDATVVRRLADAGAVLVAKLTLGALAMGDVWFGGKTRNPWNPERGSSGSSAGSAAATAAGLVGFAIGSETRGSIVSPSARCGVTGLRPTFGRVSRHGAMALAWSMDKLGPLCRSVEDCALVLEAIRGPDGRDASVVDAPFSWDPSFDPRRLRVGFVESAFAKPEDGGAQDNDRAVLETLRAFGFALEPIALPDLPIAALSFILGAEAAASFDELTRQHRGEELSRRIGASWPDVFRASRFVPAVEYIQANRVRTLAMRAMRDLMAQIDVYVCPSFGGDDLALTNLTGHPAVVVPSGFTKSGQPTSITFTGRLYREAELLAVAKAYQDATGFHLRRPPGFA
jgi:Asp-tRNA(Asn)/Glu-tRNA(Gln) amidotransferase A subunit family amidase